jgi:hypothetical protein
MPMRTAFATAIFALGLSGPAAAASSTLLDDYTWQNRLLLVFTPYPDHPESIAQNAILANVQSGLAERDLVVLRMTPDEPVEIDNKPSTTHSSHTLYRDFSIELEAFRVLLIGKDGTLKLTRTRALGSRDLFDLIDAMPMRRMEMETDAASGSHD